MLESKDLIVKFDVNAQKPRGRPFQDHVGHFWAPWRPIFSFEVIIAGIVYFSTLNITDCLITMMSVGELSYGVDGNDHQIL